VLKNKNESKGTTVSRKQWSRQRKIQKLNRQTKKLQHPGTENFPGCFLFNFSTTITAMHGKVQSLINVGAGGLIIDIECHLSNSLPGIVIVGSATKSVDEAKERLRGAFFTNQLQMLRKRITINLAPADVPKDESGFDLGIAAAILLASNQHLPTADPKTVFIGELGLDGSVRAVRGIIGKLLAGRDKGIETFFVPSQNLEQAQLVPGIFLLPIDNLRELYDHLTAAKPLHKIATGLGTYTEGLIRANTNK